MHMQSIRADSWQTPGQQTMVKLLFILCFDSEYEFIRERDQSSTIHGERVHQRPEPFGDVSRGTRCVFMGLSALLRDQVFSR